MAIDKLTMLESLHLILVISYGILTLPLLTLRVLYHRGDLSFGGLKRACITAACRITPLLSIRQSRRLMPPTKDAIEAYCKKNSLSHVFVHAKTGEAAFGDGAIHFIDCKPEKGGRVLLYFHGGGYVYPAQELYMLPFAHRAARAAGAKLTFLEYGLAPEVKYPGQLAQAVSAVNLLLDYHEPEDILFGGDSAGGNLALATLAHAIKPHPWIRPLKLNAGKYFSGVFCISPSTTDNTTADSFKRNAQKDVLSAKAMDFWDSNRKPIAGEIHASPASGDSSLWSETPVGRLILLAGADEVFVDDIWKFGRIIGAGEQANSRRQLVVCHRETHEQCVLDIGLGIEDGAMLRTIMEWMSTFSR